jgi:hypothetical protein
LYVALPLQCQSETLVLQGKDNLLAEFPNTVHSCSRHGVVATRLNSECPGSATPQKPLSVGATFIVLATVDLLETDRKNLLECAQSFTSHQLASLPLHQQLASTVKPLFNELLGD